MVIDTSAWIEWLIGSPCGLEIGRRLPSIDQWIVPTMVQLELGKWLSRGSGRQFDDGVIALTNTLIVVDLDSAIALSAADLCLRHRLATADAVIYATALAMDADLLTADAHFSGLPRVVHVPKSAH
jgi:uncharacterized protein